MKFATWIKENEIDPPKLAALIGIERTYAWKILSGQRDPSLGVIRKLIDVAKGDLSFDSFEGKLKPARRAA